MFTDQTQLEREKKMQHAMLDIKKKYGKNAVMKETVRLEVTGHSLWENMMI